MRHRQQGMTFIGLLCILALVGLLGYGALRLVPVYLNYMKLARAMDATATEAKGDSPDPASIRNTLEKHFNIDDFETINAKDVEITKDDTGVEMHAAYDEAVPYIANVSLSVHFDKTVRVR